jgi:hypothetical protein
MSHSSELFLFYDKLTLFNKYTFPSCLQACGSKNYYTVRANLENNSQAYYKEDCIFNCMTKFDHATKFCEAVTRNHPINKKFNDNYLKEYENSSKIEDLINKYF